MSRAVYTSLLFWLCTFVLVLPLSFVRADGAALYLSPESGSFALGETFEVRVLADTGGARINAAEAEIVFDPGAFVVEDVSASSSILSTWLSKPLHDEDGVVRFSGISKSPYSGSNGLLVTVTLRALRNMLGDARFSSGAMLSSGGDRSNIISSMRSGIYRVRPEEVLPEPVATSSEFAPGSTASPLPAAAPVATRVSKGEPRDISPASSVAAAAAFVSLARDYAPFVAFIILGGLVLGYLMYRRTLSTFGSEGE